MNKSIKYILRAGFCGGRAKILWIALVGALTLMSGLEVARQVSMSVFPEMTDAAVTATAGIAIHLLLSLLLAAGFIFAAWLPYTRKLSPASAILVATVALSSVWAINFLIILPVLNPALIDLMPYAVTLFSKILFGTSMGLVLHYTDDGRTVFTST